MMSPEYINYLSNKAAIEAAVNASAAGDLIAPLEVTNVYEVNAWESSRRFPIPNLGALRPAGWKLIDDWLVDASGFGSESEPALTIRQLASRLRDNIGKGYAYAIVEQGQFQIVIGVFEPDPEAKLTLANPIDDDDWTTIAEELGFEDAAGLRSNLDL